MNLNLILVLFVFIAVIGLNSVSAIEDTNLDLNETSDISNNLLISSIDSEDSEDSSNSSDVLISNLDSYIDNGGSNGPNIKEKSNVIHNVTEENYIKYFDSNGNLNKSLVSINDTICLSGNFTNKSFILSIPVILTSFNKDANLFDCSIKILNSNYDDLTTVSRLNIANNVVNRSLIYVINSINVNIFDNVLYSSGYHSYPVAVDYSNYTRIYNNIIKTIVPSDLSINNLSSDNSSWQHSGITFRGSNYNSILSNDITIENSYGIYLCYPHSNYNNISNNTIRSSISSPSFWAYGMYFTGENNSISYNTIIGMYRGISVTSGYNKIIGNSIYNLTGMDLQNPDLKGGDYGIYGSKNALIVNNSIYSSELFRAGIFAGVNSTISGNYIEITTNASGIKVGDEEEGSNSKIYDNTIVFCSGSGILISGSPSNVSISNNSIYSVSEIGADYGSGSGVGILVQYQSRSKRPYNLTIVSNKIHTSYAYAINISQASVDLWICDDNDIGDKAIIYPQKEEYTPIPGKGNTYTVNKNNFNNFFDSNGDLSSIVKDGDTLIFEGKISPKSHKLNIDRSIKIIGKKATLINATICIYASKSSVINMTISNNGTTYKNLWGIYVYEADDITIKGNKISVWDKNTSYAIYLCDVKRAKVSDNVLKTQGDELVFTLLSYEVYNSSFKNNNITAIGTGKLYPYYETICFDGEHSISELSKTYGVIFDFSSNNTFSKNKVNVTSTVKGFQVPYNPSVNILIGLYIYYDSNNNKILENDFYIKGRDPFLYGIGCSGDDTSKDVYTANNNVIKKNKITMKGDYFVNGIILRHNSINTTLEANKLNLKANNYTYGINLELSGFTKVSKNVINSSAHGNYAIELYSAWNNIIDSNTIYSNASYTESLGLHASSNNEITNNKMYNYANWKFDPAQGPEHPDSTTLENVAILLEAGSNNNHIKSNAITTNAPYAVKITTGSKGNSITNNKMISSKGTGNAAIFVGVAGNMVSNNYGTSPSHGNSSGQYNGNTLVNGSSQFSGSSNSKGASAFGGVSSNFDANSKSGAEHGSGTAGSSGSSASEISAVTKSASSQYTVPLIVLVIVSLFCYSFLNYKPDEDDE